MPALRSPRVFCWQTLMCGSTPFRLWGSSSQQATHLKPIWLEPGRQQELYDSSEQQTKRERQASHLTSREWLGWIGFAYPCKRQVACLEWGASGRYGPLRDLVVRCLKTSPAEDGNLRLWSTPRHAKLNSWHFKSGQSFPYLTRAAAFDTAQEHNREERSSRIGLYEIQHGTT